MRYARWQPWLSTTVRVALALIWIAAGTSKIGDLNHSGQVVNAYQLMPYSAAQIVGAALPFVEIVLGLLILAGLATRVTAVLSTVMFALFIAGIISVWSRGLSIDCGCFGGGGELAPGQHPSYLWDVIRDTSFLALAVYLLRWPHSWLAIDNWLRGEPQLPDTSAEEPTR